MKHFLHLGPPLPRFSCGQRFLHGLHHSPPFLRFPVRGHFGPVTLQIGAVIFEIAEEDVILEKNGIFPDVAFQNLLQDFRPHRSVLLLVGACVSGLQPDHHSESIHLPILIRDHNVRHVGRNGREPRTTKRCDIPRVATVPPLTPKMSA